MDGIILVNKEKGMTSRDVVNKLCKKFNTGRVGHTGTLDPLASGLMILCVGEGLKLVEILTGHDKDYIAKVKLGIRTDTYDITGKVLEEKSYHLKKEDLISVLNSFNGEYRQEVPIYSSIKVNGKKLYEYARNNEKVVLPKRLVKISNMKLIDFNDISFTFSVTVSSGTYIRSLINDIGNKLGILMAMEELQRTRIGSFKLEDANENRVIPIIDALDIKRIPVDNELLKKVSNGVKLDNIYHEEMVMFTNNNRAIAIYKRDGDLMKSYRVFNYR